MNILGVSKLAQNLRARCAAKVVRAIVPAQGGSERIALRSMFLRLAGRSRATSNRNHEALVSSVSTSGISERPKQQTELHGV